MLIRDIAARTGLSHSTIQKHIERGNLKSTLITEGIPHREISDADFEAWQANRRGRGRPKQENAS